MGHIGYRGGAQRVHAISDFKKGEPKSRVGITKPTLAARKAKRRRKG